MRRESARGYELELGREVIAMDTLLAWLNGHVDANTLVLCVILAHLRLGFRAMWTLLVRVAVKVGAQVDDLRPPMSGGGIVKELELELDRADTQPNLKITKVGPPPPPGAAAAGGKP